MSWYSCVIHGENFPGVILGRKEKIGFFATRVVQADSVEDAEAKALEELQQEPKLAVDEEEMSEDAQVYFEQITQLPGRPEEMPAGFSWYVVGA